VQNQFCYTDAGSRSLALEEKVIRFARVPHYVLITGERGTGKTTIARQLHELSPRSRRDFVSVNCASFTAELLESELFGYEKGAFTGAAAPKAGLFEAANGGTLFLDEIGELTLSLQAKLLKAVEEKRIRRVGSTHEREIDVRVVAATSRNLCSMVREGNFRADLLDRLNILQLETIPLRYQEEKICEIFLRQMDEERSSIGREAPFVIDQDAVSYLKSLEWRGNYRELRNFATRLAVDAVDAPLITIEVIRNLAQIETGNRVSLEDPEIAADTMFQSAAPARQNLVTVTLDPDTDDLDSVYVKAAATFIEHALKQSNGNLRRAARSMNTTHSTLSRILKKHKDRALNHPSNTQYPPLACSAAA